MDADLSGFALNDAVQAVRDAATDDVPPDLRAEVTGGPAFGADIANSFCGSQHHPARGDGVRWWRCC